jgi:hypothetical protein
MIDYGISLRFMLAGYTVILVILVVYIIGLIMKWRRLLKEYRLLNVEENNSQEI